MAFRKAKVPLGRDLSHILKVIPNLPFRVNIRDPLVQVLVELLLFLISYLLVRRLPLSHHGVIRI